MNWKKLLCAGLSGALLTGAMAGCSTADPQPTPAADDIAYQATGISRDTVLFTVDGRDVTADQYLYWLLTSISEAKTAGYLADDEAWEETIEDQPTSDYLKGQALEISKLYAVVANHAEEAGADVTEEQRAEAEEQLDQMGSLYEQYYGLTTQEWLDQQCITREGYLSLNDAYYQVQNLQSSMEEAGELTPTDEDIQNMIDSEGIYNCKHILIAFPAHEDGSEVTDEEKAARSAALQEATLYATEVPLRTMKAASRVFEIVRAMASEGNPNSVSDAGVGALAARSAVLGACLNVKINAAGLKDRAVADALIAEAEALAAEAVRLEAEVLQIVESKIG